MTVVGTGESKFILVNRRENTSRNCSSRMPTCLISFSLALPTRRKFFERRLVQVSFAETERSVDAISKKQRINPRIKVRRFIVKTPGYAFVLVRWSGSLTRGLSTRLRVIRRDFQDGEDRVTARRLCQSIVRRAERAVPEVSPVRNVISSR